MKTLKATKLLGTIVGVLALGLSAHAKDLQTVRIGLTSSSFATAPAQLAKIMGLYEKHGLDPVITVTEGSGVTNTALVSGSFDVAIVGTAELVMANARGLKIVAVSNLYGGSSGTLVLSKSVVDRLGVDARGPLPARIKALDGLRIASPSAVSSFTFSFLGAARAGGAQPVMVYLAQPAMVAALQTGAIDGFIASAPFWATPILNGSGVAWLSGPRGELGSDFTLASAASAHMMRNVAESNPEMVKNLASVYQDFVQAIKTRPEDVKAAILALYPSLDKKALDVLYEAETLGWTAKPLTRETMLHDMNLVKASGIDVPNVDKIDPSSMLIP